MSESSDNSGILKGVGGGCGALGCLSTLIGLGAFAAVAAGAFNYSVEGQAMAGGGSCLCTGIVMLIVGIALFLVGRKKSVEGSP